MVETSWSDDLVDESTTTSSPGRFSLRPSHTRREKRPGDEVESTNDDIQQSEIATPNLNSFLGVYFWC